MKRNRERTELPNGCWCSNLNVSPENWESSNATLGKSWFISYRFYSPDGSKQIQIRGMNEYKTVKGRQIATRDLLQKELDLLKNKGYNPLTKKFIDQNIDDNDYLIHPNIPFSAALQKAFDLFEGESKTDLRSSLKYIQMSIKDLKFDMWPVSDIRRRHVLRILENCKVVKERIGKKWSNNQFNHYRTALLVLYNIFKRYETVDHNIVEDIIIKKHAAAPRSVLTKEQRRLIDERLYTNNFRFWLFIHAFFHSGARLTEMSRLQGEHVDLENQIAIYLVKKGQNWEWVPRPIPDEALQYWKIALRDCGPKQYVFSDGLVPGDKKIRAEQYTRRWRTWIIKPVPDEETKFHPKSKDRDIWMNVKLYDLKHTRTTLLSNAIDKKLEEIERVAAEANGHTTTAMVKKVYDVDFQKRKNAKIRKLDIKLA